MQTRDFPYVKGGSAPIVDLCLRRMTQTRTKNEHMTQMEPTVDVDDKSALAEDAGDAAGLANKSIIKAAALLYELGNHPQGVSVTALARHTKLSRPTAFRLLLSLEQTGFVEREANKYRLGWKMAALGQLADPRTGIISRVRPTLKALAEQLEEAIGYAVIRNEVDIDLLTEELPESRLFNFSHGYVGRDFPLHASAMGKLALAELSDARVVTLLPPVLPRLTPATIVQREALIAQLHTIRAQGYAVVDDELEESHYALAVPVRNHAQRLIGLLAITGPGQRIKARPLAQIVQALQETADTINAILTKDT